MAGAGAVDDDQLITAAQLISKFGSDHMRSLTVDQKMALFSGIKRFNSLYEARLTWQVEKHHCLLVPFLWRFRDQLASDPRDKIYGLLGLFEALQVGESMTILPPGDPERIRVETFMRNRPQNTRPKELDIDLLCIDYATPVEDVYGSLVHAVVSATKRLDIICASQGPNEFRKTWVPDWSQSWSRHSLLSNNMALEPVSSRVTMAFHASGNTDAVAEFLDAYLTVKGLYHSSIAKESVKWSARLINEDLNPKAEYNKLKEGKETICNATYGTDFDAYIAAGMAMLAGLLHPPDNPGQVQVWDFCPGRSRAWFERAQMLPVEISRMVEVGEGRRYVLTDSGHFGLVPEHSEVGDVVCVLLGCSVPVILRKSSDHYNFIGECYIHGIMKGEMITKFEKGELQLQDFELY